MRPVSLVVMEKGSQWPGHVGGAEEDLVAVGVGPDGLRERTRQRLGGLRRANRRVRVGVLACNDALDEASSALRAEVARELLDAVASGDAGRVVLTAPEGSSPALRGHLLELAAGLCEGLAGTDVTVTVRFDRAPREQPSAPAPQLRLVSGAAVAPRSEYLERLAV